MKPRYTLNWFFTHLFLRTGFVCCLLVFASDKLVAQYCTPQYSIGCTSLDEIDDFTLLGITPSNITDLNTSCANSAGYDDRTGVFAPVDLMQGGSYSLTVTTSFSSSEYLTIWIDFNDDTVFSASENITGLLGSFGSLTPLSTNLNIPITAATGVHRMRARLVYNAAGSIDPCSLETFGEVHDYNVNIIQAPPCSGTPTITSIFPSGTVASCAGATQTLTITVPVASGYNFQWQQSTNGGATWTAIPGATGLSLTLTVTGNADYRAVVTCTNSGLSANSAIVSVTASPPTYTPIPYVQDFENWQNYCAISDIPSSAQVVNWTNQPATGDSSWRRDDQGITAGWTSFGSYTPAFYSGSHSARFPTAAAFVTGTEGALNLYLDCSQQPGDKQLYLRYINPYQFSQGDSLVVSLSTNGGLTFTQLGGVDTADQWKLLSLPIPSNSPQTIIQFKAKIFSFDFSDIGMDSVYVAPPCQGAPVAGTVDSVQVCSGVDFQLHLTGSTSWVGGLSYQWQQSPDGINWTNIAGATTMPYTFNMVAATYFRAIITCNTTGLSDTSATRLLPLATYYYCYCQSFAQFPTDDDIGNVTMSRFQNGQVILNNGNATPLTGNSTAINGYSNFTGLPATTLYRDSVYNFSITQISQTTFTNNGLAAAYIDYNHDGTYDPIFERVTFGSTAGTTQSFTDSFMVPSNATLGYTGMRVVLVTFGSPNPCSLYNSGETEDYLVFIEKTPCDGPLNPGTAYISDTLLCPGFPYTIIDTTHERLFGGVEWTWQSSNDGVNFSDMSGTAGLDTLNLVTDSVKSYYRLKMVCQNTGSMTYSNVVYMNYKPFYQCYCQSFATGGSGVDVSDIGIFTIGNYVVNTGGGHLNNPTAIYPYTNYTNPDAPIYLILDSTYNVSVLHTMSSGVHQDAKVTMFIDFDNNRQYDIPQERVWTSFSTATSPYLNTTVSIPQNAVKNVITGLRLIINNDINPNAPSDDACGTYLSGETEDYTVMFKDVSWLSVGGAQMTRTQVDLFPNPTNGVLTLRTVSPQVINELSINVSDVNGRILRHYSFAPMSNTFSSEVDLSGEQSGIYFITISTDQDRLVRRVILQH